MNYRARLSDYFNKRDRGWILSLLAVVCLVYLPFLGNPLVFDDLNFFTGAAAKYYADAPFRFDLRWLPNVTLGRTWAWFGEAPHFFRLGNALLHAGNVMLLFYLLRQLLSAALPDTECSTVSWSAWFGALVFACHPVAVYAAGYVVQRSILLATLFAIVMQLAYLRGLLSGQKRWLVLSVLAYALAGFSKEHSVLMPAVLIAITILLRNKNMLGRLALGLSWFSFVAVAIVLVLTSKGMLGAYALGPVFEPMGDNSLGQLKLDASAPLHILSVFTQAGLFFKYLLLWALPNPAWMSVDMREPFVVSLSAWQGWAGALAFIVYGGLGFSLLFRRGMAGLAGMSLLYPWLLFVVEFSSMRMQEIFVLYRSYLWMPGMMLFFSLLVIRWPGRRILLALGFVVLLLTSFAWNRLWVFADSYRLWNDAALLLTNEQVVGADRIFFNRAQSQAAVKDWKGAAADFERVVEISPQLAPVRYQLGMAYLNLARFEEALAQFNVGTSIAPDDGRQYTGKGMALMRMHQSEQARQQMRKGCELGDDLGCTLVSWLGLPK